MTDQRPAVLSECLGEARSLAGLLEYSDNSIVSKTVLDKSSGTITIFSFDAGQRLSEHTSVYDAVIQVIEGTAIVKIADRANEVPAGSLIVMPANVPHSVDAPGRMKMMLIMIRD